MPVDIEKGLFDPNPYDLYNEDEKPDPPPPKPKMQPPPPKPKPKPKFQLSPEQKMYLVNQGKILNREKPLPVPFFQSSRIECNRCIAGILLIINVFLPGVGTILSAFFDHRKPWYYINFIAIFVGIFQIILLPIFFFGWLWAIAHSCSLYQAAKIRNRTTLEKIQIRDQTKTRIQNDFIKPNEVRKYSK